MATLIPSLSQALPRMNGGEKRFAQRLEAKLEDDYLVWYDVPIQGSGLHPDFLLLHPRRGILVLEVKDWRAEAVQQISSSSATLRTADGIRTQHNPLEQARRYATRIVDVLERDRLLTHAEGRFAGKLCFPWAYGVVLSNITRAQFDRGGLGQVLPPAQVICKDEMVEGVEPEAFQQRLWAMFPWTPKQPLTLPQIDRIRWHIYPDLRIGGGQLDLFGGEVPEAAMPDLIRILDLQQEQLARSLGGGHRVIHGVAGSGKTMILGFRCVQLARVNARPILVLCFNRALANWLQDAMAQQGFADQVTARTFHAWCREQLVRYHVGLPPEGLTPGEYAEQLAQRVIRGVDRDLIPRAQYAAVLVDEGHDFQPEWLKLVAQMVDPKDPSLLVLFDDAQAIYGTRRFSFRSVGIQAQGRTTILRLNYRNTAEILEFASALARDVLTPHETDEDEIPLVRPESAGRRGPKPQVIRLPSLGEEARYIAGRLRQFHDEGRRWSEMAVLYRSSTIGDVVVDGLRKAEIPLQWVGKKQHQSGLDPREDSVKVLTFHSSKGLEFPVVAIPGLDRVRREPSNIEEARLLYVALTRAMDVLVVTETSAAAS